MKQRLLQRKIFTAYFTSTLSISLVLFLVALLSLLVVNANYFSNYIRENIGFTLVFDKDIRDVDLLRLQKQLKAEDYVKDAIYLDADAAAEKLEEELGENFRDFLGYNPLQSSIEVRVLADYTRNDSLAVLEKRLMAFDHVEELYYQKNLVYLINENSRKIGSVLTALSVLMLLIFFVLINNSIRLSIYSKRFSIHTMQLVGATKSFICRPFVIQSIIQGFIGALVANIAVAMITTKHYGDIVTIVNYPINEMLNTIYIVVFIVGILITSVSSYLSVNKFLRLRYNELYF